MARDNVLLACPMYDGSMDFHTAKGVFYSASKSHCVQVQIAASSMVARNCNSLWCDALNHRHSANLKWFAMLHSDIAPEAWWLDTLIEEAEKWDADLMSAVVPMKSMHGVTSTGLAMPQERHRYFCRLTTQQVRHTEFPDTFGLSEAAEALERLPGELRINNVPRERLLVNTGCMVCRVDRPWATDVWFENEDRIVNINGQWEAVGQSEDWIFALRVAEQGGKVMATRTVNVVHKGRADYSSQAIWGQPRDLGKVAGLN
jgi:hypothetical protein